MAGLLILRQPGLGRIVAGFPRSRLNARGTFAEAEESNTGKKNVAAPFDFRPKTCCCFCFFLLSLFFLFFIFFAFPCQAERYELVLGTGKQEAEARLLLLMLLQKDKYEKWLFRVLIVLSQLLVRKRAHFLRFPPCLFFGAWLLKVMLAVL